jgi:hypothetical protein
MASLSVETSLEVIASALPEELRGDNGNVIAKD